MKSDTSERLVSRAAEACVLGSMIIDAACINDVFNVVSIKDFALPEHQTIFRAIKKLHGDNGEKLDGFLLRDELDTQGKLEKIGGIEYIQKILDSVPSSANAIYYSRAVKEKAARRHLFRTVEKINKLCESDEPVNECIFRVQQLATGLDGALEPSGNSRPILKSLSDVTPLPIFWFWFNRIPLGMLTLIVGDPGQGKSFLSLYMTSKVSVGGTWPDVGGMFDNCAPIGSTIILTAEDDLAHVVRPRLDSLGADVKKIVAIEGVKVRGEDGNEQCGYFNLNRDLPSLRQAIRDQKDTKLVIVDPLSAYMDGGRIDSHKDADVRSVLMPLVKLAEQFGVAVIGIMHLNKNSTNKAVYRAMGSIAFTAAARTVWLVSGDPNDPNSRRRLLTPAKHNILVEPTSLAFELIDGRVVFEAEPVDITADEALQPGKSTVIAEQKNRAVEWLQELLPPGTSLASTEVKEQAKAEGISESTLNRAKREAGVKSFQINERGQNRWFLRID